MNARLPILILAVGAAAIFAACGGGGGQSSLPGSSGAAANGGNANNGSQPASGVRVTFSYNANAVAARSLHHALRVGTASTRRSPEYVSYAAEGMQITVTSGSASQTLYYAVGYYVTNCTEQSGVVTCSLSVPALGPTETISAIEVDQTPANLSQTTGLGTGFPSNSSVLARGSATVTLNAGGYTNVPLSMNPIVANWYDCGFDNYDPNMNEDYNTSRIVVTSGVATSNVLQPIAADYDGYEVSPGYADGGYAAQPFADLNGSSVPLTATSTSTHLTVFAIPALATPTPAPPYAATQTQSIPNTGYLTRNCCGGLQIFVNYDGNPSQSTLTFANNLTATPPPFSASPNPSSPPVPASYATTRAYTVVPISVTPTTLTLSANGVATGTVTASDAGANASSMGINQCVNANNVQLAAVSSNGNLTNGSQSFTVTAGTTPGTCTFTVYDDYSGVVTNAVAVTLTAVP
jgi:hypothetical protein